MVKLYFIGVYRKNESQAMLVKSAVDLSSFGYFQKTSAEDFLKFTGKTIIERMEGTSRLTVKENIYLCHAYLRSDNLAVTVISDEDYPERAAHTITLKILDEFPQVNCEAYLRRFQDPKEADSMMKLQTELEDTKDILKTTIENLLKRGEKLDDLVAKSDDLSAQSKLFYKTARKTNRCCVLF